MQGFCKKQMVNVTLFFCSKPLNVGDLFWKSRAFYLLYCKCDEERIHNQAPKSLHRGEILLLALTIQKVPEGGKNGQQAWRNRQNFWRKVRINLLRNMSVNRAIFGNELTGVWTGAGWLKVDTYPSWLILLQQNVSEGLRCTIFFPSLCLADNKSFCIYTPLPLLRGQPTVKLPSQKAAHLETGSPT